MTEIRKTVNDREFYEDELRTIESFCKAIRGHVEKGSFAHVGADARSILGRALNLIEASSEEMSWKAFRDLKF